MITQIRGELVDVAGGAACLRCDGLTYAVLIPAADEGDLLTALGQTVELHTVYFLEAQGQGAAFLPRLIGFRSASDRAFFELFTTVKGIGRRKALRMMQQPVTTIAAAIAEGDVALLTTLPEVGKRTAQTIVNELQEKVAAVVEVKPSATGGPGTAGGAPIDGAAAEALAVMVQLGENPAAARSLIQRALAADPTLDSADDIVGAATRLSVLD